MIELSAAELASMLGQFLWPLFRISSFFMLAPVIGTQLVPKRIRLLMAMVMTVVLMPHLPAMPTVEALSFATTILIVQQVIIGIAMALILQMLIQMFILTGQLIAMQMGLGFASMMDPTNGISVTVVSQFHLMLATLLFVTMDGHLAMIEVLAESFQILPIGAGSISNNALWTMMSWISWMFAGGVLMALPAVTSLLIVNAALGVMTRAAPQFNIMSVGFPFMVILGLLIIGVSIGGYLPHFDRFTQEALVMMREITLIQ